MITFDRLRMIQIAKQDTARLTKSCRLHAMTLAKDRGDIIAINLEEYSFIYFTYMYEYYFNTLPLSDLNDAGAKAREDMLAHIKTLTVETKLNNDI